MTTSPEFVCSVCGHYNHNTSGSLHRELVACASCGSNMRFRAIACAITQAWIGRASVLGDIPVDRSVRAIGVSDATLYAKVLERKFNYTNTFLHTDPHLDIEDLASFAPYGSLDLVVCSDVIEHTLKPPLKVLENLARAIKPGGHLVLSAPTYLMPDTIERYPSLEGFDVQESLDGHAVHYRTRYGTRGVDEHPVFHGGSGRVLELRVISQEQLMHEIELAGFHIVPAQQSALALHAALWPSVIERSDVPFPLDGRVILARQQR